MFYRDGIRAVGVDEIVIKAGATKPSLYRSFPSKDELVAACLRDRGDDFFRRFEGKLAEQGGDPRLQFVAWLRQLSKIATEKDYRGCGVTNAAVEYPDKSSPARKQAFAHKRKFRARLRELTHAMGARKPDALADALFLLMEGSYVSGQLFGVDGPPRVLVDAANILIDAHMGPAHAKV